MHVYNEDHTVTAKLGAHRWLTLNQGEFDFKKFLKTSDLAASIYDIRDTLRRAIHEDRLLYVDKREGLNKYCLRFRWWYPDDEIPTHESRIRALAEFLTVPESEIEIFIDSEFRYLHGERDYQVLTESEADEFAHESVLDNIWAFPIDYLLPHSVIPPYHTELLEKYRQEIGEHANPMFRSLLTNESRFARQFTKSDDFDRGIQLADGDEIENKHGEFFIYFKG